MHEVKNSMKQHPTQKLHKDCINFEKSQKLGQKHEMHDRMSEKDHTRWKKMIFRPKISWEWSLEREKCVWEVNRLKLVERDRGE